MSKALGGWCVWLLHGWCVWRDAAVSKALRVCYILLHACNMDGMCGVQARDLRALLQTAGESQEGSQLLAALYPSWCISPGAVLALCLLSQVNLPISSPSLLSAALEGVDITGNHIHRQACIQPCPPILLLLCILLHLRVWMWKMDMHTRTRILPCPPFGSLLYILQYLWA